MSRFKFAKITVVLTYGIFTLVHTDYCWSKKPPVIQKTTDLAITFENAEQNNKYSDLPADFKEQIHNSSEELKKYIEKIRMMRMHWFCRFG